MNYKTQKVCEISYLLSPVYVVKRPEILKSTNFHQFSLFVRKYSICKNISNFKFLFQDLFEIQCLSEFKIFWTSPIMQ